MGKTTLTGMIAAGWIAAAILGVFTAELAAHEVEGLTRFNLVDAAIFFALSYGIYRKSRICAVLALAYHLFNQFVLIVMQHAVLNPTGLVLALVFLAAFAASVAGTFLWHSSETSAAGVA